MIFDRRDTSKHSRRTARKLQAQHQHCIEGSYYTTSEIAARLSVTERAALKRLAAARKSPHPVTWAILGRG